MGKKRFYDAVRDLIRDGHDPPPEPARTRRRLSIASLLAAPQTCAACWDPVPTDRPLFACNQCLGAYCPSCLTQYAKTALGDRQLLPLRCADQQCRAPMPLSGLRGLLSTEEIARLSRFQCEILRHADESQVPAQEMESSQERSKDDSEDEALRSLMGTMGWQRCPDCGMGIERTQGCPHMVCVCGGEFCYNCGERWLGRGLGCSRRCGLPIHHDPIMALLPARFDELRDEVWHRIAALLASLRDHVERDRLTVNVAPRRAWGSPRVALERIDTEGVVTGGVVTRTVARNPSRNDARPVKMRVCSLVHPSRE